MFIARDHCSSKYWKKSTEPFCHSQVSKVLDDQKKFYVVNFVSTLVYYNWTGECFYQISCVQFLISTPCVSWLRCQSSESYRHDKGVQTMAHLVRCVELSKHHSMRGCLTQIPHPELGSLKIWRVDHKLLQTEVTVHYFARIFAR